MNDTRKPRAVSGEIMTDGAEPAGARSAGRAAPDIVDAEYETVGCQAIGVGGAWNAASAGQGADMAGLDMLRPRAERTKAKRGEPGGPLFWTAGAVLVLTAFWVSGGHALVENTSFFKREIQASGMRIASVQSRIEKQGDRSLLFVDGEAVNGDEIARIVPTLSINVLDNKGHTTRYLLGTNDNQLEPGGRFAFSSRLIAPNAGVKSVSVTFEEQED